MQSLLYVCRWLADSAIGTSIRESDNLFSIIETIHVLSIMCTAGTIAIVDLRVLGIVLTRYSVDSVLVPLVKATWFGFLTMVLSGTLLFWSEADKLYFNRAFRLKVALLLAAGANQWLFRQGWSRHPKKGLPRETLSLRLRASAFVSMGLWTSIIVAGRAIAYL